MVLILVILSTRRMSDKSDVNLRSLYRIMKNNKQREFDLIT